MASSGAGFTEAAFVKKLAELNLAQQSVESLSLWLLHHRKRAREIVGIWYKELRKLKHPKRLLAFMYLANDVIQNGKKKAPEFPKEFCAVLEKAFVHVAKYADEKTVESLKRTINVWLERGVFERSAAQGFLAAISGGAEGAAAAAPSQSLAPAEPGDGRASSTGSVDKSNPYMPHEDSYAFLSSTPPGAPPAKMPKADVKPSPRSSTPPPETEELISAIKLLDNAASGDAPIREAIAAIPTEVADLKRLDQLTNREQADALMKIVTSADSMVTGYNSRLADELEHRKTTLKYLKAYLQHQRIKAEEDQKSLSLWKDRKEKMGKQRQELKAHIESLPDLSRMPQSNPTELIPLPADLF